MSEEAYLIHAENITQIKKILAQQLNTKGYGQNTISAILQLSQPRVSNYLSEHSTQEPCFSGLADIVADITRKLDIDQRLYYYTCITTTPQEEAKIHLAHANELLTDERQLLFDHLTSAFTQLKGMTITALLPQVKLNIAESTPHATTTDDIASYSNGLIITDDVITGNTGIRLGKSKHLAELLLDIKKIYPENNAIMNIKNHPTFNTFTQLDVQTLTVDYRLDDTHKRPDVLIHPGDFGIEPCAYILGTTAEDVVANFMTALLDISTERSPT